MFTPRTSNAESTRRINSLSAVAHALRDVGRFRNALALKMHDTTTYGPHMANTMGVDCRRELDILRLPKENQTKALRAAVRRKCYDLIVATFELHHLDNSEASFFVNEVGVSLAPGGAFLVADYTLPSVTAGEYEQFISTDNERLNAQLCGGVEAWYAAHAGWTVNRLKNMVTGTGVTHAMSETIPGHAAFAAASDDPTIIVRAQHALQRFLRS